MSALSRWPKVIPPIAEKRPVSRVVHGTELTDDYAWLRAENWQEVLDAPKKLAGDIRAYLEEENSYAQAMLGSLCGIQRELIDEMSGRIPGRDEDIPSPDGPYLYFKRFVAGANFPEFCQRSRADGTETVILDCQQEAEKAKKPPPEKSYFKLGGMRHSPDHKLLAWSCDTKGSEKFTVRIRDLATGQDLDDIPETTGKIVWLRDSKALIYVRIDENSRGNRVFLHRIGTAVADDVLLHEETTPGFFISIAETQDEAFALIHINDHQTTEVRVIDPATPTAPPRVIEPRTEGLEYEVDHFKGEFVILTNDSAKDFRIMTAPVEAPQRANWRELVPHQPGRLITSHICYRDHLVMQVSENAVPAILIRAWADGDTHTIAFDPPLYALSYVDGYEFDTTTLRITMSSMTTPQETLAYDMVNRTKVLLKKREIPSGHVPEDYRLVRLDVPTHDGATMPISVLHHSKTKLDGTAPCLLYGYGAYGIATGSGFRSNVLSLVDRGFVFAIAHVRGGTEMGYRWYENGKREKKTNTFRDFITAAEELAARKVVAPDKIVAQGGSAGGMLMGAIANMRPDLFAGIVAQVPFVDVLNTMLDKDLPLTPPEWPEWGNPIESAEAFDRIRSYSPYDNVAAKAYPPLLVEAGLTDPRVTYWEPAKWVARLRETGSGGPFLLETEMGAGHGGKSGRLIELEDAARVYSFALKVVGLA